MADILAAIRDGGALPATGTAHGHVRLKDGRLARIAYAYEDDPTAAARLHLQAEAFRHLAPAGRTPKLHEVIEPRSGLPGGALIVDFIEGRAPRLPDQLEAMAETLARLHSRPLPASGSPIPRQDNPFRTTLDVVEEGARRFLDAAVTEPGARLEIVEELELMREMANTLAHRPQPLSIALADTHPGNFIVDRDG
ncbi:MAG: aminoglycoside phosphotransferase family protein, partial [Rhodospirillales bacterium]|nr:aminoglycoside phosphotransferase family protein [Rhodospirillales bacterium]